MLDFLLYFIWDYHVRYFDHSINILILHKATLFSENSFMWVFCLEIWKGQKNSIVQTRQNVVQCIGSTKSCAFLKDSTQMLLGHITANLCLLKLFKIVAASVSNPPRMHYFWRIQYALVDIEESERHSF